MKTKLFAVLFFTFTLNQIHTHATAAADTALYPPGISICDSGDSEDTVPIDIKVVVSQKRIWLIADEMPMKCLKTHIKNTAGEIVLEKCFSSKCAEWFLNIEALPKGDYTLHLGSDHIEKFKR